MNEVGIDRASDNLASSFSEVFGVVAEFDNFGGTDKCEVKRVEEEDKPLVLEVLEGDLLEGVLAGDPGVGLEERSGFSDDCSSDLGCHKICFYK